MSILRAVLGAVAVVQLAVAPVVSPATGAVVGSVPVVGSDLSSNDGSTAPTPAGTWTWPLTPAPTVVRAFDPPNQPWLPGHRGVDLGAVRGQDVVAPAPGQVTYAGLLAGRGVVVVTHPGGLRSTFEPVDDALPVGTAVAAGTRVGRVAIPPTHCEPGVCLHWGVLRGRTYLDPLAFLGRQPIVLLPLG